MKVSEMIRSLQEIASRDATGADAEIYVGRSGPSGSCTPCDGIEVVSAMASADTSVSAAVDHVVLTLTE